MKRSQPLLNPSWSVSIIGLPIAALLVVTACGRPGPARETTIEQGRIHTVGPKRFDNLPFWNVSGAEEMTHILWPHAMGDPGPGVFGSVE